MLVLRGLWSCSSLFIGGRNNTSASLSKAYSFFSFITYPFLQWKPNLMLEFQWYSIHNCKIYDNSKINLILYYLHWCASRTVRLFSITCFSVLSKINSILPLACQGCRHMWSFMFVGECHCRATRHSWFFTLYKREVFIDWQKNSKLTIVRYSASERGRLHYVGLFHFPSFKYPRELSTETHVWLDTCALKWVSDRVVEYVLQPAKCWLIIMVCHKAIVYIECSDW